MNKYNKDIRKTWQVLNTITGRVHDKSGISDTFVINGECIYDKTHIADQFCSYFTNISRVYANAIPKSTKPFDAFLGNNPNPSSMYFIPTGPNEIIKILKSCKAKKSTGDDGISMILLKQLSESCSIPLAMIINMSLEQGIVPDAMNLARVIPIHKSKSKQEFNTTGLYHCCLVFLKCSRRLFTIDCVLSSQSTTCYIADSMGFDPNDQQLMQYC